MTREQVSAAFFALFSALLVSPVTQANGNLVAGGTPTVQKPFATASRRVKAPQDVTGANLPAFFVWEHGEDVIQNDLSNPGKTVLDFSLLIYFTAGKDESIIPVTVLNNLIDCVMACLQPNQLSGLLNLGSLVVNAYVSGKIVKNDGAIDGNGGALIPIKILIPCF